MKIPVPVPVSFNIVTKDTPENTVTAVRSIFDQVYRDGDEVLVLDTGSSPENLSRLRELLGEVPGVRLLQKDFSQDLEPYVRRWLGEDELARFRADPQYATLRGTLDFAEIRQYVADQSAHDVICWIDSDDVIVDSTRGGLRKLVDDYIGGGSGDGIFLNYEYAFDTDGSCTTVLKRERFVRRSKFYWVGRCHETLIPRPGIEVRGTGYWSDLPACIRHTKDRGKGGTSDIRNYVILRREIEEMSDEEQPDPRTLFYLGNACRGLLRLQEAIDLYRRFEALSGSPDDRFGAAYFIAGIYMTPAFQRPLEAADWYSKCIEIRGHDPRGYFGLLRCYTALCRWEEALHWYRVGLTLPFPEESAGSVDPQQVRYHPHLLAAVCAKELGRVAEVRAAVERARAARPNYEEDRPRFDALLNWAAGQELASAATTVLRNARDVPNSRLLARELAQRLSAIPEGLETIGVGRPEPPDSRPRRPELAILCGHTFEPWGPYSEQTGIGGSEKMVLLLSRALQARGLNVTVYANVPFAHRGVAADGVAWRHWSEVDDRRPRRAVIYWRNHNLIASTRIPAERRFLWLHDVQSPNTDPAPLRALDAIQVQSEFHERPLAGLDLPLWQGRNAIRSELYRPELSNPKKIVYCSSPDRGLFTALSVFYVAKTLDPELEFDICYGFTPFYRRITAQRTHCTIPDLGRDASRDDYERHVNALIDRTGARMHHRVSFERCAELQNQAGIWLYPTRFPEISCMAAMETQAAGCVPICTLFGALRETVKDKTFALPPLPTPTPDEWVHQAAETVLRASKIPADDPIRRGLSERAKSEFDIEPLANEWLERILGPG